MNETLTLIHRHHELTLSIWHDAEGGVRYGFVRDDAADETLIGPLPSGLSFAALAGHLATLAVEYIDELEDGRD